MKFELKPLSKESIPRGLERAKHYRLLNEPEQAESICRDILKIDPEHQETLVVQLLALTDEMIGGKREAYTKAKKILPNLKDAYERGYYNGILCERRGRNHMKQGSPGSGSVAYEWLHEAMTLYEEAGKIRPPGNDDALLRWNACARTIMEHRLEPASDEEPQHFLE